MFIFWMCTAISSATLNEYTAKGATLHEASAQAIADCELAADPFGDPVTCFVDEDKCVQHE